MVRRIALVVASVAAVVSLTGAVDGAHARDTGWDCRSCRVGN